MKRICTVCVRGGSKGVKNKNARMLLGRPLIGYTLEQARQSRLFDVIAVSSDSPELRKMALENGADMAVERPAEMATDTASKIPVIRHCVEHTEAERGMVFDIIVDLDATSPLRNVEDIRDAVNLLERTGVSNVITAAPARRSPYFNLVELGKDNVVRLAKPPSSPVVGRQDSPACFDMNASVYVWKRAALFDHPTVFNADTQLHIMPEERSLDIDSELDFEIVEFLMARRPRS